MRGGAPAALVVAVAALLSACGARSTPPAARPGKADAAPPAAAVPLAGAGHARFDPDSAWAALVTQVRFGPRVPGSPAHRACAAWIVQRLEACGARVERDAFTYRDPDGTVWPLENILARFGPEGDGRLLLVAHWDTRPWADQDPDPARRAHPFPGANDGASGVAVLLEIARVFASHPPAHGVDLLFADGEDLGREGTPEGFCRGTRRFAEHGLSFYRRAIVVDLVGDADLRIPIEQNSLRFAPEVVDWVWERGRRLEPEVFLAEPGPHVYDDHVPLLEAGLPAVDVIDFDYPAWHTAADDTSQVSRASLGSVGRVLLSLALEP